MQSFLRECKNQNLTFEYVPIYLYPDLFSQSTGLAEYADFTTWNSLNVYKQMINFKSNY